MEKVKQAEIVFKKIVELIFPPEAQHFNISSKVDEGGIFLLIHPKTREAAGLLVGKKGRNVYFLKKAMRKWAIFNKCYVSLKIELPFENNVKSP